MKTRHPDNFYFIYPDDGAMLTYATGERTEAGIRITVRVDASSGRKMTLCGVPMKDEGYGVYSCPFELSDYKTSLTARDEESGEECSIDLYFLKNGYKKYRFSLDDNIWFLQDIAKTKIPTQAYLTMNTSQCIKSFTRSTERNFISIYITPVPSTEDFHFPSFRISSSPSGSRSTIG